MLILLLVLILLFGCFGLSPANTYGGWGWSPVGVLLLVVVLLVLFGGVRL